MDDNQSIIVDEKPLNDGASWHIWYHFFTAPPFGRIGLCLLIVVFLLGEALNNAANYWLNICLKQSGEDQPISTKSVCIYFVNVRDHNKSPAAALSLTYAMYVALMFSWTVRQLSEANMMMISGERIDEYSNLPREEDEGSYKGLVQTSPKWPAHGN
ncbi:unnamed protein product, partial [Rotaria sp. Silwood1]